MRANTGLYLSRLDHVRAAAAFLVYAWHFLHAKVPYENVPDFFLLSLLEEGHIGVALFMTLSGYLFAKIINGRAIVLKNFYWNRALRLVPLLAVMMVYWAVRGHLTLQGFFLGLLSFPTWPPGTWSIVVEFHFYAIFPVLLALQTKNRVLPLFAVLALSIGVRFLLWQTMGEVQWLSYWTIVGCIDMFVFGMLWHELSKTELVQNHPAKLFWVSLGSLAIFWHAFNTAGGFFSFGTYPSTTPIWIVIPSIQGLCLGAIIVGYERMAFSMPRILDAALAKVGEVSYSIYLIHCAVFLSVAKQLGLLGFDLTNFTTALMLTIATFPLMVLVSIVSYEVIEKPFLRFRTPYIKKSKEPNEWFEWPWLSNAWANVRPR